MKLIKFELFENTAKVTQGNTQGMGNVKSPQPKEKGETLCDLPSKKKIPEPIAQETPENKSNESVKSFNDFILLKEDGGVATATLGNTGGMGNVSAPTIGGAGMTGALNTYSGDGNPVGTGTKGSGDLPSYDFGKKFDTNPFKKKRKKFKKSTKESRHVGTETTKEEMYVTSWTDWMKSDVTNEGFGWSQDQIKQDIEDVRDFIKNCYSIDSDSVTNIEYQQTITKLNRIEMFAKFVLN
jgi:hypothetical protein